MKKRNEMKGYFYDAAQIVLVFAVYSILIFALVFGLVDISEWVRDAIRFRNSEMPPAEVDYNAGIGRLELSDVQIYAAGSENETKETSMCEFEIYREGDSPVPSWYRPTEQMAVEWTAPETATVKDIGCPDAYWNERLWGWGGHCCERWEFELYIKLTYLEFWGCSRECCEAGADSILKLWDSQYFGKTLGETLTARAEDGSLVYSPCAYVWDWEYDADGLAEIRALCEDRFYNGPRYNAEFFRLWYYHPWAKDCYTFDNVYFSTFK